MPFQLSEKTQERIARYKNIYLHTIFNDIASEYPKNDAISYIDQKNNRKITIPYHELRERVISLAMVLLSSGIKPSDKPEYVGVYLPRCHEQIIVLLALSTIGAIYVPLDPNEEESKLQMIINDTKLKKLICKSNKENIKNQLFPTKSEDISVFDIEELLDNSNGHYHQISDINNDADDRVAVVMYSSGTTGKAKGIPICHHGYAYWRDALQEKLQHRLEAESRNNIRVLADTSIGFDVHIWEYLMAWSLGGTIYLTNEEIHSDRKKLSKFIKDHAITDITMLPSKLNEFDGSVFKNLKAVYSTGAACNKNLIRKILENQCEFWNGFGPTEATFGLTLEPVKLEDIQDEHNKIPIGLPWGEEVKCIFLKDDNDPLSKQTQGELAVSSPYFCKGYIDSQLDGNSFEKIDIGGECIQVYKTGDIIEISAELNDHNEIRNQKIYFVGRKGSCTKVNGRWVNLEDIETTFLNIFAENNNFVDICVVDCIDEKSKKAYLGAFIVSREKLDPKNHFTDNYKKLVGRALSPLEIPIRWGYVLSQEKYPRTSKNSIQTKVRNDLRIRGSVLFQKSLAWWKKNNDEEVAQVEFIKLYDYSYALIEEEIIKIFAKTLGLKPATIDKYKPFGFLGGNSLMGEVLKTQFKRFWKQEGKTYASDAKTLVDELLLDLETLSVEKIIREMKLFVFYKQHIFNSLPSSSFNKEVLSQLICLNELTGTLEKYQPIATELYNVRGTSSPLLTKIQNEDNFHDYLEPDIQNMGRQIANGIGKNRLGKTYLLGWSFGGHLALKVANQSDSIDTVFMLDTYSPITIQTASVSDKAKMFIGLIQYIFKGYVEPLEDARNDCENFTVRIESIFNQAEYLLNKNVESEESKKYHLQRLVIMKYHFLAINSWRDEKINCKQIVLLIAENNQYWKSGVPECNFNDWNDYITRMNQQFGTECKVISHDIKQTTHFDIVESPEVINVLKRYIAPELHIDKFIALQCEQERRYQNYRCSDEVRDLLKVSQFFNENLPRQWLVSQNEMRSVSRGNEWCRWLAQQWANGLLFQPQIELLFHLKLSDFADVPYTKLVEDKNLDGIDKVIKILNYLPGIKSYTDIDFKRILEKRARNVLFLLDDENNDELKIGNQSIYAIVEIARNFNIMVVAKDIGFINKLHNEHKHFERTELNAQLLAASCSSQNIENIDLALLLKERYESQPLIEFLFYPKATSNSYYTQLTIIHHNEVKEREKLNADKQNNTNQYQDHRLSSHEDIYNCSKEAIGLNEIFKPDEETQKTPKSLLVLGRAGIGKSTLLQYIARTHQKLWVGRYKVVILLPLRQLQNYKEVAKPKNNYEKQLLIAQFIYDVYFYDVEQIDAEEIQKQIKSIGDEHILYALDGYDEAAQWINKTKTTPVTTPELLLGLLLNKPNLIVTTRPYAKPEKFFDRTLENMGFDNVQIENYINEFFSLIEPQQASSSENPPDVHKKASQCFNYLKQHPSVWGSCHVPICLELIVSIWQQQDNSEQTTSPITMTILYQQVVTSLQKRYLTTQRECNIVGWLVEKIDGECRQEMDFLQYLAFHGLVQPNQAIILNHQFIKETLKTIFGATVDHEEFLKKLGQLGLLKELRGRTDELLSRDYYFIHLTFQEFFAAKYLVSLLTSENKKDQTNAQEFIRNYKYNKRFRYVFWFTVGLLHERAKDINEQEKGNSAKALNNFFKTFFDKPRDLIGDYEALFLMKCLEEGQLLDKLDKKYQHLIWQSVLDIIWRVLWEKYFFYDGIRTTDVSRLLPQCLILTQSQLIEKLMLNLLQSNIDTSNLINRNMVQLLIIMLPSCRLAFLHNDVFPQLLRMLCDASKKNIYYDILKLFNQHNARLFQNWILTDSQETLLSLFKHNDVSVGDMAAELLIMDLDKAATEYLEKMFNEKLPNLLDHDDKVVRYQVTKLLLNYSEQSSKELEIKIVQETLPTLLVHKDWEIQIRTARILLNHLNKVSPSFMEKMLDEIWLSLLAVENDEYKKSATINWISNFLDKAPTSIVERVLKEMLPSLLINDSQYIRGSAVKLLDKHQDKLPAAVVVTLLMKVLPDKLASDDITVQCDTVKIFNILIDKASEEIVTKVFNETLPSLLNDNVYSRSSKVIELIFNHVNNATEGAETVFQNILPGMLADDDWVVQSSTVCLILEHLDIIPKSLVEKVWIEILPSWLVHDNWVVQYFTVKFLNNSKIPESVNELMLNVTIPGLLVSRNDDDENQLADRLLNKKFFNDYNSLRHYVALLILCAHLDKDSVLIKEETLRDTFKSLLSSNDEYDRFLTTKLFLMHMDKLSKETADKAILETIPGLLVSGQWFIRNNAAELLDKHFDKIISTKGFILTMGVYFTKNNDHAKNITEALSSKLALSQLLKFSSLLQFSIYCKAIFEKARKENIVIFYNQENGQYFLHYGNYAYEKISLDVNLVKTTLLFKYQNKLMAYEEKLELTSNQIAKLQYPMPSYLSKDQPPYNYDEIKHLEQTIKIYQIIVSDKFSNYPNLVAYEKAYEKLLIDERDKKSLKQLHAFDGSLFGAAGSNSSANTVTVQEPDCVIA